VEGTLSEPSGSGAPADVDAPVPASSAVVTWLAVALSGYALYWVIAVVQPQVYRVSFLLIALVLTFLQYPARHRMRGTEARPSRGTGVSASLVSYALAAATIAAFGWPLVDFDRFVYRAATPTGTDVALGVAAILLILEATRRTVGWILPATAAGFLLYAYYGPLLDRVGLDAIAHRGYESSRLVGTLYMTLEGIFGVPLEVAATYIILFSIYGVVLEQSGAGRFFLDWAMAAMRGSRSGSAPGRTVAIAGFLLGTVSGSGVATTVTLGAVAWPMLRKAGYRPETAAAMLSASGIGAILSPPTLGAAAFLIAEYLNISYLDVLVMATVPTVLYYVAIVLTIEGDSRRMGTRGVEAAATNVWELTRRYGYHFTSLVAIAAMMALGMTAFKAVFWAIVLALVLSRVRRETAIGLRGVIASLERGALGILSVAATTATAGIIVGVVTLTGLGLKVAGLIVALAGGGVFLTIVYAAIAVLVLGLAVPVTASYILAAVMIAPALVQVGIPDVAAHMFIFYYAVLSEVSPPTALSPFAAAALTGADPFRTMMLTWKYTAPAFIVPIVFTASREGLGMLLRGSAPEIVWSSVTALFGVALLALGFGGWLRQRMSAPERAAFVGAGALLMYAARAADIVGAVSGAAVLVWHVTRSRRAADRH
jgi:TRAP transporter 4TM/12TM fusion protein